jgi:hypothetical protein
MKTTFYFTQSLTQDEHGFVELYIRQECAARNVEVLYYRPFKTGHVPCQRECKLNCSPKIGREILKKLDLEEENYWVDSQKRESYPRE